jgi:hypothetical protein
VRRGAARLGPSGATKQLPGSARDSLALAGGLTAEPAWAAKRRRAVHRNTVGRPSGRSLGVVARGPDAGRADVTLSASSASVRRPVSGASDQCPRLAVHATGVQCPVRASERPRVRRPVWASVSVRCASAVSDRGEIGERGGGAGHRTAGMAGVGVVARRVPDRLVVHPSRSLRSKLAQAVLDQRRRRPGPGRRPGRWLGSGQVDRVADKDRSDAREDLPPVGSRWAARSPPAAGWAARHTSTIAAQGPPRIVHLPRTSDSASDPPQRLKESEPPS